MQFWWKNPSILGVLEEKNKKDNEIIISLRQRTSSTKQYSEGGLMYFNKIINAFDGCEISQIVALSKRIIAGCILMS